MNFRHLESRPGFSRCSSCWCHGQVPVEGGGNGDQPRPPYVFLWRELSSQHDSSVGEGGILNYILRRWV